MPAPASDRILTMARAAREAVAEEMERDPSVFMIGEDIAKFGGVFGTAEGLAEKFGTERVIDTPISETGFIGMATGAAMYGMRPIVELAYVDFIGVCFNQIYNYAAKTHYMSGGTSKVPMVLQFGVGGGYSNAAQHSQCLFATLAHMPGLKVVVPSNAYDAKGLMRSAIRDDNVVVYMPHKALAGLGWLGSPVKTAMSTVPREEYSVPIGKAAIVREGDDVTLVGLAWTVHHALAAADRLAEDGISAEVVDIRTLAPLDRETIFRSVQKTGRLVVSDEDYLSYGVTAEIAALVVERDPSCLKAPVRRIAFPDIPIPFSRPLEQFALPNVEKIYRAAKDLM
jgi:pyruvate/2-oxoglutarate/acetoin dehydrogenase E1 component